jgi:hypothetical protein
MQEIEVKMEATVYAQNNFYNSRILLEPKIDSF